eukprot:2942784-Rhodomonas_salina.1
MSKREREREGERARARAQQRNRERHHRSHRSTADSSLSHRPRMLVAGPPSIKASLRQRTQIERKKKACWRRGTVAKKSG